MWFWTKDPSKDFPYDITDAVCGLEDKSIWSLHKGKRKVRTVRSREQHLTIERTRDPVILFPSLDSTANREPSM